MSRKYPVTKFRLPPPVRPSAPAPRPSAFSSVLPSSSSYSSQSSPLRTFLPSISRLIPSLLPSRSLSRGRPHEIGARLRDACSERRGPRRLLPPSRNRSLVVGSLLFLHLRLPSFVRSFFHSFLPSRSRVAEKVPWRRGGRFPFFVAERAACRMRRLLG